MACPRKFGPSKTRKFSDRFSWNFQGRDHEAVEVQRAADRNHPAPVGGRDAGRGGLPAGGPKRRLQEFAVSAPELRPGDIVIRDNLLGHNGSRVWNLVRAAGAEL
jgi:hypothetical protein